MSSKTPFRICRMVLSVGCILCGISAASFFAAQFTPRCSSADQTTDARIPDFERPAAKPEAFKPVAVAFEAVEAGAAASRGARCEWREASQAPEAAAPEAVAEAVAFEAPEPEVMTFDAPEPEAVAFDAPKPEAVAFDAPKPEAVAFDAPKSEAVAFDAPKPEAMTFDAPEPEAMTFEAPEPEAVALDPVAPDAAEYAIPLSIEFSTEAFAIPESKDSLGVTARNDGQFLAIPVSDFFDPIAHNGSPVPDPVPVQLPAWPDVATLAVPSSQSAKRTTDPPFMNGRSQRVSPPPAQAANQPIGTEKIGAVQPAPRMQPVSRTTQGSGKHTIHPDCRKCTDAKQAGNPTSRIQSVSPTQGFRQIKSALSH